MLPNDTAANRRQFLKWMSASPLLASPGYIATALAAEAMPTARSPDPLMWGSLTPQNLITNPKEAINVFDFELVCRKNVSPALFGYMASGIDDEVTLRANREALLKYYLRPRRMVDVSKVDMSMEVFGQTYASPICIAPTGGNKAYHTDGEMAVSRAAKGGNRGESAGDGRARGVHRPAVSVGAGCVWSAGCGARAGVAARRNARGHAAVRRAFGQGTHPQSCAQTLM